MADTDSLREVAHSPTPLSTWLGILLLFLVFGGIVLAFVGPSPRQDNYEATRAKKRVDNLNTLRTEDTKALAGYAYVDKAKGSVRIPIERAMELTIAELKDKKPTQGTAIVAVPAAPAAPAAAPSTSPSAAPKNGASPASASPAPQSQSTSNTAATPAPRAKEAEGPKSENRSQPAGAANPPNAHPGASAVPMPSPASNSARPMVSPSGTPNQKAPGTPLPVPGTTPTP